VKRRDRVDLCLKLAQMRPQEDPRQQREGGAIEPVQGRANLFEIIRVFGWLSVIGIGGPAAHIAMMRRRVVDRDRWVSEDDFAQMVGACALVPGPNSTEMAMAIGHRRAGLRGLVLGGAAFIIPAFVIVCVVAFIYEDVLTGPLIAEIRRWLVPIVATIILDAVWGLRSTAIRDWRDGLVVVGALVGAVAGLHELMVLLVLGIVAVAMRSKPTQKVVSLAAVPLTIANLPTLLAAVSPSLMKIFLVFLQIGSVIYGSGYVLLVFLESEVVNRGWISTEVLFDAISVGQFTPGPVFTTATFIGWHLGGFAGAVVATLGIFGPSFVFAAFIERVVTWAKRSTVLATFLRGVSSASIALMAVVLWRLADEASVDSWTIATFAAALVVIQSRRALKRPRHRHA